MLPSVAKEQHATSLKSWESYLAELGINVNPFGRSQWKTNRVQLLKALGFRHTGATMKFTISDKIRSGLVALVSAPRDEIRAGKSQAAVAVFSSGPGGGKSRLLLELLELLPEDFDALYYVTFHHTSPVSPQFDTMEDLEQAEKSIAMRILYQAISVHRSRGRLSFRDWIRELRSKGLEVGLTIRDAIMLLGGGP